MKIVDVEEFLNKPGIYPIIDVRSPSEFNAGHIPGAFNIPLFDDFERCRIGTMYKQENRKKAIKEGLDIAGRKIPGFIKKIKSFKGRRNFRIHCWRGGMRSESFAWLLDTMGSNTIVLRGGYKSFRTYLLNSFNESLSLVILSGSSGSGKTEILHTLKDYGEQVIDLEGIANHKGSAFGGIGKNSQLTTEQFQNNLFYIFRSFNTRERIWLEDENMIIGSVALPETLWEVMTNSPRIRIELPKERRIRRLVKEYSNYDKDLIETQIRKIEKRLGNLNMNKSIEALYQNKPEKVAEILLTYYDKAYYKNFLSKKELCMRTFSFNNEDTETIAGIILNQVKQTPVLI